MNKMLSTFIQKNALQLAGILVVIINLWLAYQLSPLQQSIALVTQRVFALEDQTKDQADKDDIRGLQSDVQALRQDVRDLREGLGK